VTATKPEEPSAWKKLLGDKAGLNSIAEGMGKIAGGAGGKGGGKLDMSMPAPSNFDPSAASRQGAAQLFAQIMQNRKKVGGTNYGGMGLPQPTGMLGK
jgi:hypothetical protein